MQTNRTGNVTLAFRPAGLRILLIVQTNRLGILLILIPEDHAPGMVSVNPADQQDREYCKSLLANWEYC